MKKPQIILLYPKTGMDFGSTVAPPHAVMSVGAPLDAEGYDVKILDQRVEPITTDILKALVSDRLICFGISTMTGTQIKNALNLAAMAREASTGKTPLFWGDASDHPAGTDSRT